MPIETERAFVQTQETDVDFVAISGTDRSFAVAVHTRDLKIRRRRRQRESHKSNELNNQKNNFTRASHFFVHFFTVTALLRRENA